MSSFRVLGVLRAAPVLLAVACSGQIGDVDGPNGANTTTGGGTGTTGGSGSTTGGSGSTTGGSGSSTGVGTGSTTGGNPGFMGPLLSQPGISTRFARLTHLQWENAVKDLLRLPAPLGLSSAFIAEPLQSTFDTNGAVLTVQSDLFDDYQTAAETVGHKVVTDAKLLASVLPAMPADAAGKTKAFITSFGLRAFRRPVTDDEVTRYTALFNKGATLIASGNAMNDGVEITIAAMIQSPGFIYRAELGAQVADGKILLGDYEVASKLSFSLLNTMPDDTLMMLAASAQLHTRDAVLQQAQRIMALPAVEDTVSNFHNQLLRMRDFDSIKKDDKTYPLFVSGNADIKQEGLSFVNSVIFNQSLGFKELFSAPYTFANNRIKQMYGKTASTPDMFTRTDLDPTQHAGILTQIGFLAANGEGATPNIIIRGVHMAKDILCVDIPPPPDNIPMLPAQMPGQTNRQRVQTLTMNQPCASCHGVYINPLGFAFENLSGVGQWRTQEPSGLAIDATSSYNIDGQMVNFNGPVELSKVIATSQQGNACYARHWAEYLFGRPLDITNMADQNLITDAGLISKNVPSAKELILNLVATESFLARLP